MAASRESCQAETRMLRFRSWPACPEMGMAEGRWGGTEGTRGIYATVPDPQESVSNWGMYETSPFTQKLKKDGERL